ACARGGGGAGRVVGMRAAAAVAVILAPVAAALVELALAALLIAVLALEAFARTAALVVTRRARLRGICAFRCNRRSVGAWPAMLVVTVAAMAAMTLGWERGVSGKRGDVG
ncbi:MAG TPA: hypothetical protein DCR50_19625, partial [Afipia sp.]|nr:hypothetical protein [Afipia sp.]